MRKTDLGTFKEQPFPPSRTATVDTVHIGKTRHHVPVLLEVDVTRAREVIAARKKEAGEEISFAGWATKCLAQAASEHKRMHALRKGRGKLVLFDDVDVAMTIYREYTGDDAGERLPMPVVIRRANEKAVGEISAEVRAAQTLSLEPGQQWLRPEGGAPDPWLWRLFAALPWPARKWLVWKPLLGDPYRVKRTMGTVLVTSAALSGSPAWAIPIGIHPLIVALGSISRKPALVEERIEPRDMLSLSVLFDHDVVDGLPVARFVRRLTGLLEGAFGLEAEKAAAHD